MEILQNPLYFYKNAYISDFIMSITHSLFNQDPSQAKYYTYCILFIAYANQTLNALFYDHSYWYKILTQFWKRKKGTELNVLVVQKREAPEQDVMALVVTE